MRLIDADRLKAIIAGTYYKPHEVIGIINRRPTVEAIPIEWIKNWMAKSENTYNRDQIVEMLNDWNKENEDNG